MAQFTLIESKHRLTKRYWMDEKTGELKYEVGAHLTDGIASRAETADDVQSFMNRLLAPGKAKHWALISGISEHAKARVVPKDKVASVAAASSSSDLPVIARSKEYFQHPDGPGVLVLDYDGEPISKEDLYAAWLETCPWLECVGIAFMPSTGSHIRDFLDCALTGAKGWHAYVIIDEGKQIPNAVEAIYQATFETHGRIVVASNGSMLPRSLVDITCREQNRLFFESGAELSGGEFPLSQDPREPWIIPGRMLEAASIPESVPFDEWKRTNKRYLDHTGRVEPEARTARTDWVEKGVAAGKGTRESLIRALEDMVLGPDFMVTMADGSQVSVESLMSESSSCIGTSIPDPIEPDYNGGALCAIINRWGIYSFAHGGRKFAFATTATASTTWPQPEDLGDDLLPVPAFDYELLPEGFRPYVRDMAKQLQVPPDFIAVALLASAGSTIGRQVGIRPNGWSSLWVEIAVLWAAIVAESASRKTAAMIAGSSALRTLESNAKRAHEFALADHKHEMAAYKARETGAMKQAEKMAATDLDADIESILKSIGDAPLKPEPQTYIVNTSTVQKLAHICNQNPRGILMFRDEMLAWLSKIDKDEHAEERSFFVMGWNGNSRYIDDTIKHGRIEVDAVCLSVLGGIQPAVLVPYLQRAIASGGGDGLFARFGLLVWPDVPTKVVTCREAPDRDAQQEVARIFARLDRLDVEQLGASHSGNEVPSLCFSDAAQEMLIEWRDAYETSLRESDEDESLKSHLIKYSSLVPRLALVFGLIDEDIDDGKIGMDSLRRALDWTKFLEAHARRACGAATRGTIGTAKRILGKIQRGEISSPFVARDIYRRRWSGLTDSDTVKSALDLLEDYDWLRGENVQTGGRSSRQYTVNPAAMSDAVKR